MEANSGGASLSRGTVSRFQVTLAELLLWMLATCVVLAYEQWRLRTAGDLGDSFRWHFNARLLFFAPLDGACLASLILLFWQPRLPASRFGREPGHWFLIIRGASYVFGAAQEGATYLIGHSTLESLTVWPAFVYGHWPTLLVFALAVLAAAKFHSAFLWTSTFLMMALGELLIMVHSLIVSFVKGNPWFLNEFGWGLGSRIVYSLPAILVIFASVLERNRRRDVLHWVGVAVLLLMIAAEWPIWLSWLVLFR